MHQSEWNQIAEKVDFNLEIDISRFRNQVQTDHKILDFGCGYGRVSKLLRGYGYTNVIGVDSSISMIERGWYESPELDLELVTGITLPFSDQSFDAVIVCAVFTCITDLEIRYSQIKELLRILKPEGLLHMVEFCMEPRKLFTASIGVPMLHSSPQELREMISIFSITREEVINTNTIGGNAAKSYSVFAKKSPNKSNHADL